MLPGTIKQMPCLNPEPAHTSAMPPSTIAQTPFLSSSLMFLLLAGSAPTKVMMFLQRGVRTGIQQPYQRGERQSGEGEAYGEAYSRVGKPLEPRACCCSSEHHILSRGGHILVRLAALAGRLLPASPPEWDVEHCVGGNRVHLDVGEQGLRGRGARSRLSRALQGGAAGRANRGAGSYNRQGPYKPAVCGPPIRAKGPTG